MNASTLLALFGLVSTAPDLPQPPVGAEGAVPVLNPDTCQRRVKIRREKTEYYPASVEFGFVDVCLHPEYLAPVQAAQQSNGEFSFPNLEAAAAAKSGSFGRSPASLPLTRGESNLPPPAARPATCQQFATLDCQGVDTARSTGNLDVPIRVLLRGHEAAIIGGDDLCDSLFNIHTGEEFSELEGQLDAGQTVRVTIRNGVLFLGGAPTLGEPNQRPPVVMHGTLYCSSQDHARSHDRTVAAIDWGDVGPEQLLNDNAAPAELTEAQIKSAEQKLGIVSHSRSPASIASPWKARERVGTFHGAEVWEYTGPRGARRYQSGDQVLEPLSVESAFGGKSFTYWKVVGKI